MRTTETLTLNMGPQHPSTHGVLRLELELDGETVLRLRPHVGYLHTGFEKSYENQRWQQAVTLTDRMDYLAPLSNNLGYVLAVEQLLNLDIPPRAQAIRVLLAELTRIASHLVWLGTHALDLGAMTVFLYCFRERETIMDIFDEISGVRMMTSFIRVGGLREDLPDGATEHIRAFIQEFPEKIQDYERLLTNNRIFRERTEGVGVISAEDAVSYSLTGPNLRASGVAWDLRKANPYSGYENYEFDVPTQTAGDVFARYLVRLEEMRQSREIVRQALDRLPGGPVKSPNRDVVPPPKEELAWSMESLIRHFKIWTEGFHVPAGEVYHAIESPRGELGYYLVSTGGNQPYRCHVRAPSFLNVQTLEHLARGRLVADLVAVIGSIDIVLGEIDR
jgi:NADH-quinone oxidoreductase subunit D